MNGLMNRFRKRSQSGMKEDPIQTDTKTIPTIETETTETKDRVSEHLETEITGTAETTDRASNRMEIL